MINQLVEVSNTPVEVQDTALAIDVLGRYVGNTWLAIGLVMLLVAGQAYGMGGASEDKAT